MIRFIMPTIPMASHGRHTPGNTKTHICSSVTHAKWECVVTQSTWSEGNSSMERVPRTV